MSNNKIINSKLMNFDKSTSTFMHLMSKYKNQKKDKNNEKMHITQAIDKKRQELEINEKDDMYIYKEAKNTAYINQELINEYGKKAKTQSYDISKYSTPIKLYKQQFFDPTKDNYINNNIIKKLNYKGLVKLPLINKYYVDKKPLLTYSNSIISKSKMNSQFKNHQTIPNNNSIDYSFDSNINSYHLTPKKAKNADLSIITKTSISPSTLRNNESDKNLLMMELFNKDINYNNNVRKSNKYFYLSNKNIFALNGAYITRLSNFKDQLTNEEMKKRNYFSRNDYGCKLSKEKYNFLNKKYFE